MKKISRTKLTRTLVTKRKEKKLTQAQLAEAANINRSMIGRIENGEYTPSLYQIESLGEVLGFKLEDLLNTDPVEEETSAEKYDVNSKSTFSRYYLKTT